MIERLAANISPPATTTRAISDHLRILNKAGQFAAYRPNRAQRDFLSRRTGRDLILKARQLGFSTAIQADLFVKAATGSALCATLSHDDESTQKLRRMAERFWSGLPEAIRPERGLDNATTTTYPTTRSEVTIVTAGNVHKGRGGTYTHVHGSEVAFWKDAQGVMAGILQGVPKHGEITLESTPNGAQGWFYEKCVAALDGDPEWTLHFYPWWWDDDYRLPIDDVGLENLRDDEIALMNQHGLDAGQIAWRRAKQRQLGMLFAQEYPEDVRECFLLSGLGYFGALNSVFTAPTNPQPQPDHQYVAGLDFGQSVDYTVCVIIDATTRQQVDILRINRLPWDDMRSRVLRLCREWNVIRLVAEKNSMGAPNIEALFTESVDAGLAESMRIEMFVTGPQTKAPLIGALRIALDEGGLRLLPDPDMQRELRAYRATQTVHGHWQFSAPDGEHDDCVIATALAWRGVERMSYAPVIDVW